MKRWVVVTPASVALVVAGGAGVAYAFGSRLLEGGERTQEFSHTEAAPVEGVGGCAEVAVSGTVAVHYLRFEDVLDRESEWLSELRIREPIVGVSVTGCGDGPAPDVAQVTISSAFAAAECAGEWRLEEVLAEDDVAAYAPACGDGSAAVRTTTCGAGNAFEQHQSNAELAVEGSADGREEVELCAAVAVAVGVRTEQNEEDLALVDLGEICFRA